MRLVAFWAGDVRGAGLRQPVVVASRASDRSALWHGNAVFLGEVAESDAVNDLVDGVLV